MAPLLPASDPLLLGILPGASILVAALATALASAFGLYLLAHRHNRWWTLLGVLCALASNALSLTTLQAIALIR